MCITLAVFAGLHPTPAIATQPPNVIISAVFPNPASGTEWVVIENQANGANARPFKLFLPLMAKHNHDATPIDTIGPPPVPTFVDISGWQLGHAGIWYTLPNDLPPIPAGAKVIVYFDGLGAGANEYDYTDGAATLHTPAGMVNVLPDAAGRVLLYAGDAIAPENLRAQFAWGD